MTELVLSEAVPLAYALVARTAESLGIRVLFIKGPVAEEQGLRSKHTSVDVDVMVDPGRRQELASALTGLGWVDENPHTSPRVLPLHSWTHRHVRWPCELDLHDRFPGFFIDPQSAFDALWARRSEVTVAARVLPTPDVAGHSLILALHYLRDPHHAYNQNALARLAEHTAALLDAEGLADLASLAHQLGAPDTARPFLELLDAPVVGVGSTSDDDLRAWQLRTNPGKRTAVSWIEELRRRPRRSWPGYLWYALVLSEKELRMADPSLPEGRGVILRARIRRLRRGLGALPSAVRQVASARATGTSPGEREAAPAPSTTSSVVVVQEILTGYRVPFFAGLRERLRADGVELLLVHGFARGDRASRGDHGALPWAVTTRNRHVPLIPGVKAAVWQSVPRALLRRADLVVLEQASRHLLNYRLLARSRTRGRPQVVLWGHGGNLQASGSLASRASERLKRGVSARPYWWLAYTSGSADRVAAVGFPRDRITVVQNAVEVVRAPGPVERVSDRCVYVGSLYPDKRIDFLLEAGRRVAQLRPDFRLVVIGDGEERGLVEEAASTEDWVDFRGTMFGEQMAAEVQSSQLLLMPGLVGLAVVDSFALECPMVTVDLPFHSPEIEYLQHDVNGVCLPTDTTPDRYGDEVAALLGDPERLERLRAGCRASAATYTIDAMVENAAAGLMRALRDLPG